jgi:hypothetical protein
MKKILVIYYSQTGQVTEIAKSLLSPLAGNNEVSLTYYEINPVPAFPFPWSGSAFFDAFPESVLEIPCAVDMSGVPAKERYDLIILCYQVWYLSPSIPVSSFLQTPEAAELFRNVPVITIIGCRNMWLMAQEKLKKRLNLLQSRIVGNIVFYDKAPNLVSVVTISAWLIGGKREGFLGIFPRSGVSVKDIRESSRFGEIILNSLQKNDLGNIQQLLNREDAVTIKPNLMVLEKRGAKSFKLWAKFIRSKGGPGSSERKARVKLFSYCLPAAILILSPVTTIVSFLILTFGKKKIRRDVEYFSQNSLNTSLNN